MSQSVNLILKSTQINIDNSLTTYYAQTVRSSIGTVSNNRSSFIWNNINLKTLLGDMFEKYERFNICLNFVAGGATGSTAETIPDNRMFQVKLTGLPFTSSYNHSTLSNIGTVCLTTVQVPLTASTTWVNNFFTVQYYTFTKQTLVNIAIDLHCVSTDATYVPSSSTMLGHCIFSFNIYGVDKFENVDITSQRMDLKGFN